MRMEFDEDGSLELYVKSYLKDVVQRHVKEILEHQLKDVVVGELAKLRLDRPNAPAIGVVVDAILENRMRNAANSIVPDTVKHLMTEHFKRMANNI